MPANFPLLIKPASYLCNLRCAHCFYLPGEERGSGKGAPKMTEKTLRRLVRTYLELPLEQHMFIWQGGEPTLMGKQFYVQAAKLQKQFSPAGGVVGNCLQTNATLLTPDFSSFLARNDFLVGVSIDGPAELHDAYRMYAAQKGSHAKVMENYRMLSRDGVKVNALTLLTSRNVARAAEIFHWLADRGILFQQYIPCVEFEPGGGPRPWTVDPKAWGEALCALFDAWWTERGRISVRYFDALLHTLHTGMPGICHMGEACGQYVVVEHNGDLYPCDFFVKEEWKLGNIHTTAWAEIWEHPRYLAFSRAKSELPQACTDCQWLRLCRGDCQKHRYADGTPERSRSWLCEGYRVFFTHAIPKLPALFPAADIGGRSRHTPILGL